LYSDLYYVLLILAAESICKAQGSRLLSVSSIQEQSFLKTFLKPLSGKIDGFWMGLTDQDQEQIFRFSDKTPLLFNYWYLGFPKDDSEHEIKLLCFFFLHLQC